MSALHLVRNASASGSASFKASSIIPTLTPQQQSGYLSRIGFTEPLTSIKHDAETLALLTTLHVTHVPFENLLIHRSLRYFLAIDDLYRKIVTKRQGGFCFEVNGLFGCLLHSLGFSVRFVDSCVNRGHYDDVMRAWTPWTHIVSLVTIEEQHFYVDVGFGAAPLQPIRIDLLMEQTLVDGFKYRVTRSRPSDSAFISFAPSDYEPVSQSSIVDHTSTVDQSQDDYLIFERWSIPTQSWIPRTMIHARLQNRVFPDYFLSALERVQHRNFPFRSDVLVTLIPRPHMMWTLSGRRLIETVTPYGERVETMLEPSQTLAVLNERFGIDLTKDHIDTHPLHFGGVGYEPPTTPAPATATAPAPAAPNDTTNTPTPTPSGATIATATARA